MFQKPAGAKLQNVRCKWRTNPAGQKINNVVNFKDFKFSFDNYKDKVDKILTTDLTFLWKDDYYDGMLWGMLRYQSQYYRFETITDYKKHIYPRVFAIIMLTEQQIADETFWHDLFVKHVGNHNDFTTDELITRPYTEHHLFYDEFKKRPEVNYDSNIVKGWFIEQVRH